MEFKGTKGNWTIEFSHIGSKCAYAIKEFKGNAREDCCNAKLIAAAPVLLEACITAMKDTEMLLSGECDYCEENLQATIANLKEAIEKAIG